MHFTEFAAQGARGFSPSLRLALRQGYVVLTPSQATPPFCGLVTALLYPDGRGGEATFAAPGQRAKVGFSLVGNDQNTYRIVRELGGPGGLSRLNKTKQAFETVSENVTEIAQFLRGQVGLPTRTAFEQIFTFTAAQLPSRRPKSKAGQGVAVSGPKPMLASQRPVGAAADTGAAQARLAELRRERALADELEQLQYSLDTVTSQIFELEQRLKGTEGLQAALAEAEQTYEAAPTPESLGLPVDIVSRLERYPQAMQRRDEALARLDAERDQEVAQTASVEPLTKDRNFLAALAVGVVFFVLGFVLDGVARYVALLDIPAFGFAALLAFRYVDDLQHSERKGRKGEMRAAREKKIHDEFEVEAQYVRAAMAALKVESHTEALAALDRKALLLQRVQEYRDQLAAMEADPEYASAAARCKKLKAEQESIQGQLSEKGAYVRDVREVDREIARTEESIQLALAAAPVASAASAAPGGSESFEDPSPMVLKQAADLLQSDIPSTGALLRDRCAQYLQALTDKRYLGAELDKDGRATLLAAGNKRVPAEEVPGRELDLYYMALRLTVVEKVTVRVKVPFLMEDAPGVDEPKLALFSRMVRHLGTLGQVLHVTGHPAFASVAEASVNL